MGLQPLDLAIIAVYLIGITLFGVSFRRSEGTLKNYFLGGRNIPWWAISLSIVAGETSILTIISTPGLAYTGDFAFLQLVFGYLLGRIVICVVLLPHYFKGELFTAYELMQRRFGTRLKSLSAAIFLGGRAMAEGVRLWALAIVGGVVLDALPRLGLHWHFDNLEIIGIIAFLTLIYTFEGGMKAVIWTDFIQICIYVSGAILSFFLILRGIPGGWAHVAQLATAAHKFRLWHFAFSWTQPFTFWAGLIGGMFLTTATDGTDQLIVQRLLSAKSERDSRRALLSSWVIIFFQFVLFLFIGVLLWVFYQSHALPAAGQFGKYDRLYPAYIARYFPIGLAGLLIAAIIAAAMSNLSAALNALSSTTIMDFYRPHFNPGRTEKHYLRMSRLATVGWTVVLAAVAYASRDSRSVLIAGLAVISYPFSALLGVFLLGTMTRRTNEFGAIIGMILGVIVAVALGLAGLPFTWFIVGGTVTTFVTGYAFSWLRPAPPQPAGPDGAAAPHTAPRTARVRPAESAP